MSSIVTFGEIMARFEAAPHKRISQVMPGSLEVTFAGAEANVAASLVSLGESARFVTALPDNPLGHACEAELRAVGIDCSAVLTSGEGRLGLYFIEHGANQRSSNVMYDRTGSSVAICDPTRYWWDEIFTDAGWFHITGITPAISREGATASLDSVKAAKNAGIPVSVDLNFRSKLWRWSADRDPKQLAGETMSEIVALADVLVANEADASDVFGIEGGSTDVERGKLDTEGYRSVASQLTSRFPNLSKVAITLRESVSASYNRWGAMVYDAEEEHVSCSPRATRAGPTRPTRSETSSTAWVRATHLPRRSSTPSAIRSSAGAWSRWRTSRSLQARSATRYTGTSIGCPRTRFSR